MSTIKVNNIQGTGASTSAIVVNSSNGTCTANVTNNLSNRNKVINGDMQIAQRGTSTSGVTGIGIFACDRQKTLLLSAGTWTVSQSSEAPSDNGFTKSLKYDCTSADTSLGSNDYFQHYYRIEGQDLQDVRKGTSNAKPLILSFWVKTNKTGTYNVELIDQDNSRLCSQSYTVANTNWNKYTIVFPADTTGAFNNDNGVSLDIGWWLAAGSTYTGGSTQTSFGSFTQANRAPDLNVNLADSTSNEWYITGIQLEIDHQGTGIATEFEHKMHGEELARCQRYYEVHYQSTGTASMYSTGDSTIKFAHTWYYHVCKRANPTVSLINSGYFNASGGSALTLTGIFTSKNHVMFYSNSNQFRLLGSSQVALVQSEAEL